MVQTSDECSRAAAVRSEGKGSGPAASILSSTARYAWVAFGDGWTVTREGAAPVAVEVPHDAMLAETRSPDAPSGFHGAYFPGGRYVYRKRWRADEVASDERTVIRFEGVARRSVVRVNDVEVGGETSAYREFEVDVTDALRPGADNEIEVVADTTEQPSSRWYVGSGIHRPVSLQVRGRVTLGPNGVVIRTRSIGDPARIEVHLTFSNPDRVAIRTEVDLSHGAALVAGDGSTTDGTSARFLLDVPDPRFWSADDPHLYDCRIVLFRGDEVADVQQHRIGIRTVALDARRGLLVNDRVVLLRGANIHHDNGVIGAVALPAAERRRARILKQNGFNAIRSAHNPISRAMLDACDEIGLYVMDETTDVWWTAKTQHDDSRTFLAQWRADLEALTLRDRNRPSVIMLSISNENSETASDAGTELARAMKQVIDDLDGTRPVAAGVNLTLNALGRRDAEPPTPDDPDSPPAKVVDSTVYNMASQVLGPMMRVAASTKRADRRTRGIFDILDVAGYNYGDVRFRRDAKAFPTRIMLGTEDMPGSIARIWPLVEQLPNLIGDFIWAGWDYLGEVGVGHWVPGRRVVAMMKAYPYLTSGSGVIDITGVPGADAFLAQAAWGTQHRPAIAVRPLDVSAGPVAKAAWRGSDALPSWSWSGREGQRAEIEVYSAAETVELRLDGELIGTSKAGAAHGFTAQFRTPYRPGELIAIARSRDGAVEESRLRSARGPLQLRMRPDRAELAADGGDLAYVTIEVTDDRGVVESLADDLVTLSLDGPAVLAGFGSGAPATEESFADAEHRTYYGRALAVLRAQRTAGTVRLTATSKRHGTASCELRVG